MSWFTDLFASKKKKALREKAKELWREICKSLESLGEEIVLCEEKEKEECDARTLAGPGLIRIMANFADQISVSVEVLRLMRGDYENGYLDAFLNGRRTFIVLFREDFDGIDPAALAQEFHGLSREYDRIAEKIQEIRKEGKQKKDEIDKYAREQIRQLQATPA